MRQTLVPLACALTVASSAYALQPLEQFAERARAPATARGEAAAGETNPWK